jgi:hypothetical protein
MVSESAHGRADKLGRHAHGGFLAGKAKLAKGFGASPSGALPTAMLRHTIRP